MLKVEEDERTEKVGDDFDVVVNIIIKKLYKEMEKIFTTTIKINSSKKNNTQLTVKKNKN